MTADIQLVCLDMAGTTIDDAGTVEEAFAVAMGAEGVVAGTETFTTALDYVRQTMGQSKIEVFTALFDGDARRAERANQKFERAYRDVIDAGRVAPLPGAAEAIARLRAGGSKVALTTGFSPATRDAILDAVGWKELVDLVVSPSDCGRGRPYPDMILWSVLRLGADAVAAVAVAGDTVSDLIAGDRAGASIVAGVLTGAHDAATLATAPHTHILPSITDLAALLLGD